MNRQSIFQMLKQNFEVLIETHTEMVLRKWCRIFLGIESVFLLYSSYESSLQYATG